MEQPGRRKQSNFIEWSSRQWPKLIPFFLNGNWGKILFFVPVLPSHFSDNWRLLARKTDMIYNFALHFIIFYVQMYSNYFQYDIFVKFLARMFLPVLYLISLKAPPPWKIVSWVQCTKPLRGCLYERRDGTFFIPALKTVYMRGGTGRFPSRVYMRMFLPGTERLYDKNCPALAGIPVERTGIPLCRDGTKNVPAKFFPYKRNGTNNRYIHAWRDPV